MDSGQLTGTTVAYILGEFGGARCTYGVLAPDGTTVVPFVNASISENDIRSIEHGIGIKPIIDVTGSSGTTELVLSAAGIN